MRRLSLLGVAMVCVPVMAQTHVVKKPDSVVRAVGVYEWTGEPGKATASRLVPVSVFINGKLEDAGIYLARPVPFALQTGNIFELEEAGVTRAVWNWRISGIWFRRGMGRLTMGGWR